MSEYQGQERRKFVRVPFIFPVKYRLVEDEENREFHALSDNLSEGGIKIICMHKVGEGKNMILQFSLPTSEGIFEIHCQGHVAWYQENENRSFCGVQFSNLEEEHQLVLHNFIKRICEFRGAE